MSQRPIRKRLQIKKNYLKGHASPGENVAGKTFLFEYKIPISFQASVATLQDNFFKIPELRYDFRNYWIS